MNVNPVSMKYWIAVKDENDFFVVGIPFEMARSRTLIGAKREASKLLNSYVPPTHLCMSEPVAYIAAGEITSMIDFKRVAEKRRNKRWVKK